VSRDLRVLLDWASDMSTRDPVLEARPLWAQIASEVETYVAGHPAPVPDDTPSLFGATP
jgi:hypothetical protein